MHEMSLEKNGSEGSLKYKLSEGSDSCHGRVSGINKICIRSSYYCRSQVTVV